MAIEVKNVNSNKKLQIRGEMEFNTVLLVQLWEKCEDAKLYMGRLNNRIQETRFSSKWEKLVGKSFDNVVKLSEEMTNLLTNLGAFNALKRTRSQEFSGNQAYPYYSSARTSSRTAQKGAL